MQAVLANGARLTYEVSGSGPTLLLLRPLGGSLLSWGEFARALAQRVRVISFDQRGVGASSPAPLCCTTRGMAEDALGLLAALGVERAHVYGISLGGMVASWLSLLSPERVARLVLASTLPRGTELRGRAILTLGGMLPCLFRSPPAMEAGLAARVLSPQFRAQHPDRVQRIRELAAAQPSSRRAILSLAAAAASHDVSARLPEITAETLVLVGERDPLLSAASQRELFTRLPRASFGVIAEAGHDVSAEAPLQTAERVLTHVLDARAPEPS